MAGPSQQPTVEQTAASPPPLPEEPLPISIQAESSAAGPTDQPIDTLGDDDDNSDGDDNEPGDGNDNEEEEEWDPASERLPGESSKNKGKAKATEGGEQSDAAATLWQAVWSPEQNAYYFWNTESGAVTWTNPLAPPPAPTPEAATSAPAPNFVPPLPAGPPPPKKAEQKAAYGMPPDIDPDLAYLLPASQRGGPADPAGAQTALFNARTGRFTPADYAYSVDHLDEYNRAKRMNSHYFDVEAWEKQKTEEHAKKKQQEAEGGVGPQRTTKKDMERYRRKQAEKKHRARAWLRD